MSPRARPGWWRSTAVGVGVTAAVLAVWLLQAGGSGTVDGTGTAGASGTVDGAGTTGTLGAAADDPGLADDAAPLGVLRAGVDELPGSVPLRVTLATRLEATGAYEEAAHEYAALVRLRPLDPDLRYRKAFALARGGDTDGARASLQDALELQEDHPEALLLLGALEQTVNDAEGARVLTRFLDHRLYRVLMAPTRGVMKAVNVAAQAFIRSVSKVVGGEVFDDAIAFFQAFEGMEEGFKQRAELVLDLLNSPATSFVLVASPKRDTVQEARFFAGKLAEADIAVSAVVVNRMHPRFTSQAAEAVVEKAEAFDDDDLVGLYRNLADFALVAQREEGHLVGLAEQVAPAPMVRVPFLRSDVHDLDGLRQIEGVGQGLGGRAAFGDRGKIENRVGKVLHQLDLAHA